MQGEFFGRTRISKSWLFRPPLYGTCAVALSVLAVALPTVIRLGMSPQMDDQACTIFCPFVLVTTILCGWRYALAVAVGSAISCNTILMGTPYTFHLQYSEIEVLSTFVGYSALVIFVVELFRA